jgi:hypothetical protein
MYYAVNVDHEGTAAHLTRSDCDRFKCCISKGMDVTDYEMLWNDSAEDGNVSSARRH